MLAGEKLEITVTAEDWEAAHEAARNHRLSTFVCSFHCAVSRAIGRALNKGPNDVCIPIGDIAHINDGLPNEELNGEPERYWPTYRIDAVGQNLVNAFVSFNVMPTETTFTLEKL